MARRRSTVTMPAGRRGRKSGTCGGVQMLFGSSSLEVLIGVVLLFLVLAVIASAVTEIVAQVLALRSRTLHDAISSMLFDEATSDAFYKHPLIKSLSQQGRVDKVF